jgi:hypothetical protein
MTIKNKLTRLFVFLVCIGIVLLSISAEGCPWQKKHKKKTKFQEVITGNSGETISWQIQTIDSLGSVGSFTSIVIDNNNKLHISYLDNVNNDLKYATNISGTWFCSTIDSSGDVGVYSSLALDTNNNIYIAYYDSANQDLKLAEYLSSTWSTYIIESTGDIGAWSDLALDRNNKTHIAYCDWTNGNLKYADNISGTWNTYMADSNGAPCTEISIAVDSNDKNHICYYDWANYSIKYITDISGTWISATIEQITGTYTSIITDSNDKVHISYYDSVNKSLKYATNESGNWVISVIDSDGDVGKYCSITRDSNNKIYISYYNTNNECLKYTTNRSGDWVIEIVDSADNVGGFTDIIIDSNNQAHISYYDLTNGDLKYGTNSAEALSPVPPATIPLTPSNLAATTISYFQINLSWIDNADNEIGFKIERKTNVGGTYSQVATVGVNMTSYSDTGCFSNTTYYYRVKAYNSAGDSGYSSSANATTPPPSGASISFVQQPITASAGATITPAVTVIVRDQYDNPLPGISVYIIVLGGSPTLYGTSPQTTDANGIAIFNDLYIRLAGINYRLRASLTP